MSVMDARRSSEPQDGARNLNAVLYMTRSYFHERSTNDIGTVGHQCKQAQQELVSTT